MNASRAATRPSGTRFRSTSSNAGFGAPPGSLGETSPRNWCWNSSVVGIPARSRSGWYVSTTYSSIGRWAVFQKRPCSTYVSSETTPASRIAKSAAVEVGNFCARNSAKSPVKPASPGHVGQVAIARLTEVWNSRTRDRFAVSSSTLISMPAVRPFCVPPWIVTFTSAHSPLARTPTESAALFVLEKRTLS